MNMAEDLAAQVGARVRAIAVEWSPPLAQELVERRGLPLPVAEEMSQVALMQVGVATALALLHAEAQPDCTRAGHPYTCGAAAAMDRIEARLLPRLRPPATRELLRELVQSVLCYWAEHAILTDKPTAVEKVKPEEVPRHNDDGIHFQEEQPPL